MSTAKRPLIVCIDDDPAMLATVVRCLRREQVEIRSTISPGEALSWIAAEEVAVLLSDYDMPEMTGAELAGHARRIRPETVRVLLTGKRTLETAVEGINQGEVFRFLNKPFDNEVLRQTVRDALERHRELLALSGDRERRARREALRQALEAEYPGLSRVDLAPDERYEVTADPWGEAAELGLAGLPASLDRGS